MSNDTEDVERILAALDRGLAASAASDAASLAYAARQLLDLMKDIARRSPWGLEERSGDFLCLADALVRAGHGTLGRELLIAAASVLRLHAPSERETLRRVLSDDGYAAFSFVQRSGADREEFGLDDETVLRICRDATTRRVASVADMQFAVTSVRAPLRFELAAVALGAHPTSREIWRAAADALVATAELASAAVAYEQSIGEPDPGRVGEIVSVLERLGRGAPDPISEDRWARRPRCNLPSLVNVALLRRALGGPAGARESVARHAGRVSPAEAAIAYLDAGVGEIGVGMLIAHLGKIAHDRGAESYAITLARLYFALGRTVEAVAALRVMLLGEDTPVATSLDVLFGSCKTRHRLRWSGLWAGAFPRDTEADIQAAAIAALLAEATTSPDVAAAAETHCGTVDGGSAADRAGAIAALESLGPSCAPIVQRWIATGGDRTRVRLAWLLDRWVWRAADARFRRATGLGPLPRHLNDDMTGPFAVDARVRAAVAEAIDLYRSARVDEAGHAVDRLCVMLADPGPWRLPDTPYRSDTLIEHLVAEGDSERARSLIRAIAGDDPRHELLERYHSVIAADEERLFDVMMSGARGSLPSRDMERIASRRLETGALSEADAVDLVSKIGYAESSHLLGLALRRFPSSVELLEAHGQSLLARGHRTAALRVFERAASLRSERARPNEDTTDADSGRHRDVFGILAGYPPRISSEVPGTSFALREAGIDVPLLVNIAILRHELRGHASAVSAIEQHRATSSPAIVAAAFRVIGDVDEARTILEREVRVHGKSTSGRVLDALIGLYAGLNRLADAFAVARLVLRDSHWAKEHVQILIDTLILQFDDDVPDEVLAYEARFNEKQAMETAIARLLATCTPSPEEVARAQAAVDAVDSDDFTIRSRALAELRAIGPAAATVVAEALGGGGGSGPAQLRELLESWVWIMAESRIGAEIARETTVSSY